MPPEDAARYPYDEIAQRILAMGRLAAERLDPAALQEFRTRIVLRRAKYDHPILREWLRLADDGPDAVRRMLCDETEFGRYMRSMVSLRGLVSREERDAFFRDGIPEENRDRAERAR
jgi:hypothetical protein